MTYSTDTFAGDGSQVEFTLTFDYIERDHVQVSRIVKETKLRTVLTPIATGTPTGDQFIWETDNKVKVGTAPALTDLLEIARDTPENEQIVQWADGSYIIADDLNTEARQFLYGIQELEDKVSVIDGTSLKFLGTIDLTSDAAPAQPVNGNLYVNTGSGTVIAGWTGIVGQTVVGAEQVLYSSANAQWEIVQTPASQVGVLGVTGTAPVVVDNSDTQNPIVQFSSSSNPPITQTISGSQLIHSFDITLLNSLP